jgi:hypothetical protein
MNQKKYMDIERLKEKFADGFTPGDRIVIQEKIDGANFSIRYDKENNEIKAFSRRNPLDFKNNLRGAWEWSQKLDVNEVKEVLGDNLVLFGEWLVSHTIVYPNDRYKNAYFYDVYDVENTCSLSHSRNKLADYGARCLCSEKMYVSVREGRYDSHDENENTHTAYPVSEASPEEESLAHGFNIVEDRGSRCCEAAYRFEKSINI